MNYDTALDVSLRSVSICIVDDEGAIQFETKIPADWEEKTADRVLKKMFSDGIVDKFKGDDGWVYRPNRSATVRVKKIMTKLGNCGDSLWRLV